MHLDFLNQAFNGLSSSKVNRYRDYWKQTFMMVAQEVERMKHMDPQSVEDGNQMVNKCVRRSSVLQVIMQMKLDIMGCHFKSIQLQKRVRLTVLGDGEVVERCIPLHCWREWVKCFWRVVHWKPMHTFLVRVGVGVGMGGSRLLKWFIRYFWLQQVSVAVCSLLTVAASFVAEHGVSSMGSVVVVHGLSCASAPGISLDQGCPRISRQILHHETTREVPPHTFWPSNCNYRSTE